MWYIGGIPPVPNPIEDVLNSYGANKLKEKEQDMFAIKKVIFNDPATIILWLDGTKTVVKVIDEKFDPEKGLAMAIAKKALGNVGHYYETFKKWLPDKEDEIALDPDDSLYPQIALKGIAKLAKSEFEKIVKTENKIEEEND